jgi:ornithine cyclodeaminase/alanine dehydrogenase-like protein (mu-crystallin family)
VIRLISNDDVRRVLEGVGEPRARATEVIEAALVDMSGESGAVPSHVTPTRGGGPTLITATGKLRSCNAMGGRINAVGRPTRSAGARHGGFKVLYELDTLNLVALVEDDLMQPLMLGTRVAIATKWLARPDARVLGVLGSGRMAAASLDAITTVRDIDEVRVYSPDPDHRRVSAVAAGERLGIDVRAVDSGRDAVAGADIITCATNTHLRGGGHAVEAAWLEPGMHVNTVARSEVEQAGLLAAKVVPVSLPEVLAIQPEWDGLGSLLSSGALVIDTDLAHVVAGAAGRTSPDEITVYLGASTGAEHLAFGHWIYSEATRRGLGLEWDIDGSTSPATPPEPVATS